MKHFIYEPFTGQYLGAAETENGIRPKNSTLVPPPENVVGKYRCFYGNKWAVVDDLPIFPKSEKLFLNIAMAGGDGMIPVGIVNNGEDAIQFTATLRISKDPGSDVVPYSKEWRIVVRDTEDKVYDVLKVAMVDGVITLAYNTVNPPAVCHIDPSDMTDLVELEGVQYALDILGDVEFKVYRDFT